MSGRERRTSIGALAIAVTSLWSPRVLALWEDEQGALLAGGSLRSTTAVAHDRRAPQASQADGFATGALRLTADGSPAPWYRYELHVVDEWLLLTSPATDGALAFGFTPETRYRLLSGSWRWFDEGDVQSRLLVDRANVQYQLGGSTLTLGRQAISFGKAQFWSALDVFLPFDARQFDREYKAGVDAARLDVGLDDVSGLNLVGSIGRRTNAPPYSHDWYGSALLARAYTNLWDWDLSAQFGKIYGGVQAGGGLAGALGPVEVRGEIARYVTLDAADLPSHTTAVLGVGRLFDCSLNLQAEYLYNGAGDDEDLTRAAGRVLRGRALQMSRHVAGALASYEIHPLLTGSVATLVSISDGSVLVQPGLSYSVSDESDLVAGALIARGRRPSPTSPLDPGLRSEFGTYPDFYYLQYRVYF